MHVFHTTFGSPDWWTPYFSDIANYSLLKMAILVCNAFVLNINVDQIVRYTTSVLTLEPIVLKWSNRKKRCLWWAERWAELSDDDPQGYLSIMHAWHSNTPAGCLTGCWHSCCFAMRHSYTFQSSAFKMRIATYIECHLFARCVCDEHTL